MKIIAIIQARIGSTRLPGKVLMDLSGKPVLEHVINRVISSKFIQDVVVATTIQKEDLNIVKICANLGINVFCGSENDVLDRYYQAARLFRPDHIVRVTSDCPLIDPKIIDDVISLHLKENSDYTSNTLVETYPDGEDVEVFTFKALELAWEKASLTSEREHVTPYIRNHPDIFRQVCLENKENLSDKRWTLDEPEDFKFIKTIYDNLFNEDPLFSMEDILTFIKQRPGVEQINQHIIRNEGYQKSLREDYKFRGN